MTDQSTQPPITCGGCDNTWTGVTRCHCSGCHELFASLKLFDAHRVRGRCHDPATLTNCEFRDGMWRGPKMSEEAKQQRWGTPDIEKAS